MSDIGSAVGQREDDPFVALYEREFARACRLAHLLTGSNSGAEDIAQEAFLRMRPRLASIDEPGRYLTTSVVNLSRNWHRRAGREQVRLARMGAVRAQVPGPDAGGHDEVLAVVDRLPFRQRTVLVARYWLDLSEAEIAVVLGCRPGTVKSLAARAMTTLRKELG